MYRDRWIDAQWKKKNGRCTYLNEQETITWQYGGTVTTRVLVIRIQLINVHVRLIIVLIQYRRSTITRFK